MARSDDSGDRITGADDPGRREAHHDVSQHLNPCIPYSALNINTQCTVQNKARCHLMHDASSGPLAVTSELVVNAASDSNLR